MSSVVVFDDVFFFKTLIDLLAPTSTYLPFNTAVESLEILTLTFPSFLHLNDAELEYVFALPAISPPTTFIVPETTPDTLAVTLAVCTFGTFTVTVILSPTLGLEGDIVIFVAFTVVLIRIIIKQTIVHKKIFLVIFIILS